MAINIEVQRYVEPDETEFLTRGELIEEQGSIDEYRLSRIVGGLLCIYEPRQNGVFRYPPVQVQVDRDPKATEDYINMRPTIESNWNEGA